MERLNCGIVGGGVVGLSLAWELASRGHRITVFEKGRAGRKASWAGAGILLPSNLETTTQPLDRLLGLGSELHRTWATRLNELTQIDNGYWECGGIYLARTNGEKATLAGQCSYWNEYGVEFEKLDSTALESWAAIDTQLDLTPDTTVVIAKGESQIRNSDHLKALEKACRLTDVKLIEACGEVQVLPSSTRDELVISTAESISRFDAVFVCGGAWSESILKAFDVRIPLVPVRGHMLLYNLGRCRFPFVINEGPRYVVPRKDGFVLVGSTTEEVGFDESTNNEKIDELKAFACELIPELNEKTYCKAWTGLRPASFDGFPYMGAVAGMGNLFVATGHFKAGLQVSPAVAVMMADLLERKTSIMDYQPFEPSRLDFKENLMIENSATIF